MTIVTDKPTPYSTIPFRGESAKIIILIDKNTQGEIPIIRANST